MREFEEQTGRYLSQGPSRISPFLIPKLMPNAAPGSISIEYGLCGINTAVSTACASAGNAVSDAYHAIQWDHADVVVSGGTEGAITPMGLGGFISARSLSPRNHAPAAPTP